METPRYRVHWSIVDVCLWSKAQVETLMRCPCTYHMPHIHHRFVVLLLCTSLLGMVLYTPKDWQMGMFLFLLRMPHYPTWSFLYTADMFASVKQASSAQRRWKPSSVSWFGYPESNKLTKLYSPPSKRTSIRKWQSHLTEIIWWGSAITK